MAQGERRRREFVNVSKHVNVRGGYGLAKFAKAKAKARARARRPSRHEDFSAGQ